MVDSGSATSFIRPEVADQLKVQGDQSQVDVVGANSTKMECRGRVQLRVELRIGDTTKLIDYAFVSTICAYPFLSEMS